MNKKLIFLGVLFLLLGGVTVGAAAHQQDSLMAEQLEAFTAIAENSTNSLNANLSKQPCRKGYAAEFPCHRIDQWSFVPSAAMGATFINDIWGWTDPETGKDYALVGAAEGMIPVDISAPMTPVVLGMLPTHSTVGGEFWRDIKVYANHAFVVSENDDHGMQVFDLTQLRDVDLSGGPVIFSETAHYDGISHAHNIAINEDTGFAYVVGSDDCSGGLHMVDISDPANPAFAGCYADDGYTHDTQCVIYSGPDADYQGHELCFSSNANFDGTPFLNTLSIADVTDKANPVGIANVEYAEDGYSHQGWLTPDQAYFLHGDELDEFFLGNQTRTRIWDVTDLDNPAVIGVFDNDTTSIDHNIYIKGRYAYVSNYTSGLRIYDTIDIANGELVEVGFFDVYPENDNASFEGGTWSNYPFFAQDRVVAVTSMDRGLFILHPRVSK